MVAPGTSWATAYLAFGANLGDRAAQIAAAATQLGEAGVRIEEMSPLYETDPVTPDLQPLYLNAAARARTTFAPDELLALCLAVERAIGRERPPGAVSVAPRPIDIDLLLLGDVVVDRPGLVVPHPRLLERAFVRIPLADVAAPGLCHPLTGEPLDRAAPHAGVRRF